MRGGKMRVGEKPRTLPAPSPKSMRMTEDVSRASSTPFVESGYTPNTANRLGQVMGKKLGPDPRLVSKGVKKSKGQPQTSLNLGIGKRNKSKHND